MTSDEVIPKVVFCHSCNDTRKDPHFGGTCLDCKSQVANANASRLLNKLFPNQPEIVYCQACNDLLKDPYFGGPCLDCQSQTTEVALKRLSELFPDQSELDQVVAEIKGNQITVIQLHSAFRALDSTMKRKLREKTEMRNFFRSIFLARKHEKEKLLMTTLVEGAIREINSHERRVRQQIKEDEILQNQRNYQLKSLERSQARERIRAIERLQIMSEKCRVEPLTEFPGWHEPWKCRCLDCDAEVHPRFSTVRKSGWACATCSRSRFARMKAAEQHDERARLMDEVGGVVPLEPYKKSGTPWKSKCKVCNSIVTPRFDDVVNKKRRACIVCSRNEFHEFSFDFKAPGVIYFVEHLDLMALKVGITSTSSKTDRIGQHELNGWTVIKTWSVQSGFIARDIEQKILRWWRVEKNLPFVCTERDMPQGGFTETIQTSEIDPDEVVSKVEGLIKQLDHQLFPN